MAQNGFESAIEQLKTVAKVDKKLTIDVRKKAAKYFADQLRPVLAKSNISKKHMADGLDVKVDGDDVIVYFKDHAWYWYLNEHGHRKRNGRGRVRGTQAIRNTASSERSKLEQMMVKDIIDSI